MKKKRLIEIILTAVLIIILVFAVGNSVKKIKHGTRSAAKPGAGAAPAAAGKIPKKKASPAAMPVKPHYQLQEEESRNLELTRNPFAAAAGVKADDTSSVQADQIALSGILWDKDKPLAIINNKVVKTGDKAGGCRVVEIKEESVVLNDGARDFELKLGR
ncbi:MAG: hypothetical protein V1925_00205 [Candidatus Omnitrophota bacterium]